MSKRVCKILLVILALAMLPAIRLVHRKLNAEREQFGLTHTDVLENAPPALAFTTVAFGGFRGLIANVLWYRANDMQVDGNYFEALTLSDWITKLQPDIGMVWANRAWNMSYNISVQFPDFHDRWLWINSGIELLRDQGLRYNPNDVELYFELAWIYQDKIGSLTDYGNNYFKAALATEMMDALGASLNLDTLLDPKTDEDRRHIALLRGRFKLDPVWMRQVDEHYGPFDWRLPEAHAVYWADLGLEKCQNADDRIKLRRVIWQSMQKAVMKGRLVINRADRRLEFGPNLDMIPNANRTYDEMFAEESSPAQRNGILTAHRNFLKDAICLFYTHNRMAAAAQWLAYAKTNFPDAIPAKTGLDEFVVARVTESVDVNDSTRVNALVEGLIGQSFYNLAIGEYDQANGYALLARRVWERYQIKFSGKKQQAQLGLPSLAEFQQRVREQISRGEHGFSPALLEQLRAHGWMMATNSSATNNSPPMEVQAQPVETK